MSLLEGLNYVAQAIEQRQFRQRKNTEEILTTAKNLPNPFQEVSSPEERESFANDSVFIPDGTFAVVIAKTPGFKKIGTSNMSICVAAWLHSEETQTAAVAHFTIGNSPSSLKEVLFAMFPGESEEAILQKAKSVKIAFRGGLSPDWSSNLHRKESRQLAAGLLREVEHIGLDLVGAELFPPREKIFSNGFIIDPLTGRLVSGVSPKNISIPKPPYQYHKLFRQPLQRVFPDQAAA